jgi:hypothetical protein
VCFPEGENILALGGFFLQHSWHMQPKIGLVSWELSEWLFIARYRVAKPEF